MEKQEYNIGLDIGTASVGWAAVEAETSKVLKKGKKALWGVRLFEEAETAVTRRMSRGGRRRFDRRRKRIKLLRRIFEPEIKKVDVNFFKKMEESFYCEEDIKNKTIHLTEEEKKQIKKYHEKYPTIYHVRKMLVESEEKQDIRLIYLALHHMIKYRGNFLNEGETFNAENLDLKEKWKEIFKSILDTCLEMEIDEDTINDISYQNLEQAVLQDSNIDKKKSLEQELKNFNFKKEFIAELGKAIVGNKFSVQKMLLIDSDSELKISFKGSEYEDRYDEIESIVQDKIEVLQLLKELYSMIFLKKLFNGESNSLSALMVNRYEKHKNDLNYLKEVLRYNRKEYNRIFRTKEEQKKISIYDQYIHNVIDFEDFKKEVQKSLENTWEYVSNQNLKDQYTSNYKIELEKGTFLPRITEKDNGKFPYQLNLVELEKIVEQQGKYYPFLLECGENGKNKLKALLEFRIPYYVGPLNDTTSNRDIKNENAWLIRKNNAAITPYNFEMTVDTEASAEKFITRMISHCTYLLSEPAIPANSILYSEYKVWNELKQIKINDHKIPTEIQNKIFENLFLKTDKSPSNEIFEHFLLNLTEYSMYKTLTITGYSANNKFANSMKSYVDFFGDNGIFQGTNYKIEDAEEIIRWITIFEDKKILEKKVRNEYPDLSEPAIKKIINKKYKGWSNLSQKLLTTKYYKNPETMETLSILDLLKTTDQNFMQIINEKKYNFNQMINDFNQLNSKEKLNYGIVDALATSPKNKRGIYQSLLVLEEIIEYIGYEPKRIVIEMARSEEEKKRKDSKKDYLSKLYTTLSNNIDNYKMLKKQLDSYENEDFNNQKLFLYFIQEGKSLYSGKPLNIENLNQDCEIDHIIPQTLIKDDSIENKALVLKEENQHKAASFVLPKEYRNDVNRIWWKHLQTLGLLTSKKLHNLSRSTYTEEDIEGFINRQLVETRQITKHVANIIKNYHEKSDVVYLKANLSHSYREKFELFKYREINDYHHAHDAYLAAVLGEYKQKHLKTVDFEALKEVTKKMIKNKSYHELKYGYVINSIDNQFMSFNDETGEILFDADGFNQIVDDTLYRNDILVSKKVEYKTGEFYNQTKNKKGMKGVYLKDYLPSKWYGSYTSLNPAYAMVVKYQDKGKEKQKLIGIPIYIIQKSISKPSAIKDYIVSLLNIKDANSLQVIVEKVPFYSLIDWDGKICRLVGATDKVEVCNAIEFHIDKKNMQKWKYTLNRLINKRGKVDEVVYNAQLDEIICYIVSKVEKEYKLYQNLLDEMRNGFRIDDMNALPVEEKEKIVIEMFHLLKCNSRCANLSFLLANDKKMSMAFGKKNDRIIEHAKVYYQSATGLKEFYNEF